MARNSNNDALNVIVNGSPIEKIIFRNNTAKDPVRDGEILKATLHKAFEDAMEIVKKELPEIRERARNATSSDHLLTTNALIKEALADLGNIENLSMEYRSSSDEIASLVEQPLLPHIQKRKPSKTGNYTVQRGDSLWSLARDHNTTVDELARLNNIDDANRGNIYAGERLVVPEKDTVSLNPGYSTSDFRAYSTDGKWDWIFKRDDFSFRSGAYYARTNERGETETKWQKSDKRWYVDENGNTWERLAERKKSTTATPDPEKSSYEWQQNFGSWIPGINTLGESVIQTDRPKQYGELIENELPSISEKSARGMRLTEVIWEMAKKFEPLIPDIWNFFKSRDNSSEPVQVPEKPCEIDKVEPTAPASEPIKYYKITYPIGVKNEAKDPHWRGEFIIKTIIVEEKDIEKVINEISKPIHSTISKEHDWNEKEVRRRIRVEEVK
jgi:LysM repeat protein